MKKVEGKKIFYNFQEKKKKNTLLYSHFIIIVVQGKNLCHIFKIEREKKALLAGNNQMSIDLREQ